jgi:hypothetical protein
MPLALSGLIFVPSSWFLVSRSHRSASRKAALQLQLQLPTSIATQWQSLIRHQLRFLRS